MFIEEFQKVSKVSNTSLNMRIWLFLETGILCFASHCSLVLIDLAMDFNEVVAAFWLSVFASVCVSLLAYSSSLSSQFFAILMLRQ